jgi:hypothetical protein
VFVSPMMCAASPRRERVCVVKNARNTFFTTHTPESERRRREHANGKKIRHLFYHSKKIAESERYGL